MGSESEVMNSSISDRLHNGFKRALAERKQIIGYWCTLDGNAAAEIAAGAGFDWLLFDTEHVPASDAEILHKLQIAQGYSVWPVVRPAWNDRVRIKLLLDVGAQTLLIPYVETAQEAAAAVSATRYPPAGTRGVAGAMRASRYGRIPQYQDRADSEICLLVQIESRKGLENLEAIAATEGVDGVFIGPADLAANCEIHLPEGRDTLRAIIDDAMSRIAAIGKPSGILSVAQDDARHWLAKGAGFVAVGVDATTLARATSNLAESFKSS